MRNYINTKETFYSSINDIPKNIKLLNNFLFFKCEKCGLIKEKRSYSAKPEKITFICRECCYKQSNLEKYGVENTSQLSNTKDKTHQTLLERYGTTSTSQFIDYSKIDYTARNEKSKKTNLEKYGVDNAAKSESVKSKIKETNMAKYGFTSASQSEEIKSKQRKTLKEKYGNDLPGPKASKEKFLNYRLSNITQLDLEWLDSESFNGKYNEKLIYYHFKCNKCGNTFEDSFHTGWPVCRHCNPVFSGHSNAENEIADYISSIYSGTLILRDRKLLNGLELDIYLPDLNLAFEYNGTYWHGYRKDTKLSVADFKKNVEKKRLLCQEKGIRLINIDEADYLDRPEVYKRFIDDLVLVRKRVYARNCVIKNIDDKTAKDFCNYYHVNGFKGGSIKLGLYHNDELLIVAIFAKHPKYENECIRLCYKTGYDVIGGWAKITKHFGKKFLHYVNLKYFMGENKTGCGYRIWINKKLLYRQQLQGKGLEKYCKNINPELSDFQNCLLNNGIAIFDVGNDIRIYNS